LSNGDPTEETKMIMEAGAQKRYKARSVNLCPDAAVASKAVEELASKWRACRDGNEARMKSAEPRKMA
jgi:hypothetical protein